MDAPNKQDLIVNQLQPFYFDDLHVRGCLVQLDARLIPDGQRQTENPASIDLVGQALVAVALMSSGLKGFESLLLQTRDMGPIQLLLAECTHEGHLRGAAHLRQGNIDSIEGGQLLMSLEAQGQRFQSIVPLATDLASSMEQYYQRSEQLPTRLIIRSNSSRFAGILLQVTATTNPNQSLQDFEHALALLNTIKDEELLQLEPATLLNRLYHEHACRLLDGQTLHFVCRCSRERSLRALQTLGNDDLHELFVEQNGRVEVRCDLCRTPYIFVPTDVLTHH